MLHVSEQLQTNLRKYHTCVYALGSFFFLSTLSLLILETLTCNKKIIREKKGGGGRKLQIYINTCTCNIKVSKQWCIDIR